MGFKANGAVQLDLPAALDGLVVLVRGRTVGEWLDGASIDLSWEDDDTITGEERTKRYRELYGEFISDVVSWNLDDPTGAPVPVTVEGLCTVDTTVATPMVAAWAFRRVKLPDPLDAGLPVGAPSVPLSIPMAPSTPNPAN